MPKRFHAILEIVARNPVTATVSVPNDNDTRGQVDNAFAIMEFIDYQVFRGYYLIWKQSQKR